MSRGIFMFDSNIFGTRLRELRSQKGISQKPLSELLEVTVTQISDMENGRTFTTIPKLYLLCEYFNVSADYLIGLSDDPKRH